jgi:hypothetical protein
MLFRRAVELSVRGELGEKVTTSSPAHGPCSKLSHRVSCSYAMKLGSFILAGVAITGCGQAGAGYDGGRPASDGSASDVRDADAPPILDGGSVDWISPVLPCEADAAGPVVLASGTYFAEVAAGLTGHELLPQAHATGFRGRAALARSRCERRSRSNRLRGRCPRTPFFDGS